MGSPASQNSVKKAIVILPNGQRKKNGKGRGEKYLDNNRVAEVAQRHEGPLPLSLDSDENFMS